MNDSVYAVNLNDTSAPSPQRARIFIAEKGLDLETVEIDLSKREQLGDDFRRINPRCTVPVLELDDGTCLTENAGIAAYLEALQPDPPLLGRTAEEIPCHLTLRQLIASVVGAG